VVGTAHLEACMLAHTNKLIGKRAARPLWAQNGRGAGGA
jgi:hypothetical protein